MNLGSQLTWTGHVTSATRTHRSEHLDLGKRANPEQEKNRRRRTEKEKRRRGRETA
jgi:hypothetical protein